MAPTLLRKLDELSTPVYYTCLFTAITAMLLLQASGLIVVITLLPLVASLIVIKAFLSQASKGSSTVDNHLCSDAVKSTSMSSC